jgi:hypothetical protein
LFVAGGSMAGLYRDWVAARISDADGLARSP